MSVSPFELAKKTRRPLGKPIFPEDFGERKSLRLNNDVTNLLTSGAHGTSSSLPVVLRLSMSAWAFAVSAGLHRVEVGREVAGG
jgi:hypothetical protein